VLTRILIADDHGLVRSGLRALLSAQPEFEVVGEALDGVAVIEACRRTAPEVVLMDLTMPGRGGVAATRDLRRTFPDVKVVVVTMHEDAAFARQAFLAGAAGYVLKKSLAGELVKTLRAVRRGETFVTTSLEKEISATEHATPVSRNGGCGPESLTPRELEILTLVALGHTTTEVAKRARLSERTVETHRKHITLKLGLRTRADLVRFALEYKLIGS
jgi:two-component system response regulator NreC